MKFKIQNEPMQIVLEPGYAYAFNAIKADGVIWVHIAKTKPKQDHDGRWNTKDATGFRYPVRQKLVGEKDRQCWVWTTGAKEETIVECFYFPDNQQKKFVFIG